MIKVYAMAYSVEQELNSSVELLVHVMSSVECSGLHQDYITGLNMLCGKALYVLCLHTKAPSPSLRRHLRYDDCLEDKRESYQNCSVLYVGYDGCAQ